MGPVTNRRRRCRCTRVEASRGMRPDGLTQSQPVFLNVFVAVDFAISYLRAPDEWFGLHFHSRGQFDMHNS
jgi:hypothetical protein